MQEVEGMAERRMFAKTIIDSDAFLDMPLSTQALYFHLSMRADDDGFINNPKKIQRMVGGSDDDMKLLIAKNFIIPFESGVVVIKHWKIHNYIRNDRYKETVYQEEKAMLETKENKAYTFGIPSDNQVSVQMDTQVRIGKDRLGKSSVVEGSVVEEPSPTPPPSTNDEYNSLIKKYGKAFVDERIERAKKYSGTDMSTVKKWCEEDYKKQNKGNRFNNFPQRDYDYEELEKDLLNRKKVVTAKDDPDLMARVEAMKSELGQGQKGVV